MLLGYFGNGPSTLLTTLGGSVLPASFDFTSGVLFRLLWRKIAFKNLLTVCLHGFHSILSATDDKIIPASYAPSLVYQRLVVRESIHLCVPQSRSWTLCSWDSVWVVSGALPSHLQSLIASPWHAWAGISGPGLGGKPWPESCRNSCWALTLGVISD